MSTSEKKSLLNPVGKVSTTMQSMVDGSMIGIAQVDLSLAPVGTELFVQPSVGRLKLEVEIANSNALSWQKALAAVQLRVRELRGRSRRADRLKAELKEAKAMLLAIHDSQYPSPTSTDIYQFLFGKRK